jgi:hypothetical protein
LKKQKRQWDNRETYREKDKRNSSERNSNSNRNKHRLSKSNHKNKSLVTKDNNKHTLIPQTSHSLISPQQPKNIFESKLTRIMSINIAIKNTDENHLLELNNFKEKLQNKIKSIKKSNEYIRFYQDTFSDDTLSRHVYLTPKLRKYFLTKFPLFKQLVSRNNFYSIVNNQISEVYGKIDIMINEQLKKSVYYIRLNKGNNFIRYSLQKRY